jgi:hypothetical protein
MLEQRQLARVLFGGSGVSVAAQQEPPVHQLTPCHGQIGFRGVKLSVSFCQPIGITSEDRSLIEHSSPPDPLVHAANRLPRPAGLVTGWLCR